MRDVVEDVLTARQFDPCLQGTLRSDVRRQSPFLRSSELQLDRTARRGEVQVGQSLLYVENRLCADLELESGELVIYDTRNHNAWIQSDQAVALAAVC